MERSKSSKLAVGIVLLIAGVGLFVWALNARKADVPASIPESSQTARNNDSSVATATEALAAIIVFTNDGFTPNTLSVKKGTVVTVKNESSKRVQFSSDDHPSHRDDPSLNMKTLAPGESGTFTAVTVGTQGFHDHIDDSKVGTLIVTE